MKITSVKTLFCNAGWRPWIFVKITTDSGLVGYSEVTESFGSPSAIAGAILDFEPLLIGLDPGAYEHIFSLLYRITRQSPGSVIQKAIAGVENALLDIKGKALGVPVYELLGGPTREKIRVYWSHFGSTRVRSAKHVGQVELRDYSDITSMCKELKSKGYTALKTNLLLPAEKGGFEVLMQGFRGGYGASDQLLSSANLAGIEKLMGTIREGVGQEIDICLDLNFHFKTEGNSRIARALEPFRLMWLELDSYHPDALAEVKRSTSIPICSGENLYTSRDYRPFFDRQSMHIAAVDVVWNGVAQAKKIADLAEIHEINVAPHNHYSHLATLMSAHYCASLSNVQILELDVDDVPWRESLLTKPPTIKDGFLHLDRKPGWGADLNEEVLAEHPWP